MKQLEELKIKIRSLAFESKIIRQKEQEIKQDIKRIKDNRIELSTQHPERNYTAKLDKLYRTYHSLHEHRRSENTRVSHLRNESRLSQLAYTYISGKPYSRVEQRGKPPYLRIKRLKQIIDKFGDEEVSFEEIDKWFKT